MVNEAECVGNAACSKEEKLEDNPIVPLGSGQLQTTTESTDW